MNRTLRLIEKNKDDRASEQPHGGSHNDGFAPAPLAARPQPQASLPEHLVSDTLPDVAPGERPLGPGQTIDQYTVDRLIASGGTARVYRATHRFMGHVIALKVLRENIARRPDLVERFQKEARALKQIKHANIVDIETAGLTERGEPFIAMEYIEGQPLRDRLETGWRPPLVETLNILISVADGVHAAHEIGIVHRDLKPENIMCPEGGGVKVVDFGLARVVDAKQTDAKGVVGTAAYISPERLNGMPGDVRSDIYSLGIMAYELIDGRNPMVGTGRTLRAAEVAANQLTHQPAWLWNVPEQLANAVARSIEKHPKSRFKSMLDFSAALRAARAFLIEQQDAADRARHAIASEAAAIEPIDTDHQRGAIARSGAYASRRRSADDAHSGGRQAAATDLPAQAARAVSRVSTRKPLSRAIDHELARHPFRLPLAIGAVVGLSVALSAFFLQRSGRNDTGAETASSVSVPLAGSVVANSLPRTAPAAVPDPLTADKTPQELAAQRAPDPASLQEQPAATGSAAIAASHDPPGLPAPATKSKSATAATSRPTPQPAAKPDDSPIFGNDNDIDWLPPPREAAGSPAKKKAPTPKKTSSPAKSDLPGSGLALVPSHPDPGARPAPILVPSIPPADVARSRLNCLPKTPESGLDQNACGPNTEPRADDERDEY